MAEKRIRRAVYAGSFDPPTNGHLWMIREAQMLFDELVVAIGVNPDKRFTYTLDERKEMLRAITTGMSNVRIASFENPILGELRRQHPCRIHRARHPHHCRLRIRALHALHQFGFAARDFDGVFVTTARVCRGVFHHGQRHGWA